MTVIDPKAVDWREADDNAVGMAASSGIAPAVAEAKRRGLMHPDEHPRPAGPLVPYSGTHTH